MTKSQLIEKAKTSTPPLTKKTKIGRKVYTVHHRFQMVGNWIFTDTHGTEHLVDGEDVSVWVTDTGREWRGIDSAIEYAKHLASENDHGIFYWKVRVGY